MRSKTLLRLGLTATLSVVGFGCSGANPPGTPSPGDDASAGGDSRSGGDLRGGDLAGGDAFIRRSDLKLPPGADPGPPPMAGLFTAQVTEIDIEVDYETGAAPHTGVDLTFGRVWSLFETNVDWLFRENPKTITIDSEPADMQDIGPLTDQDFTASDLLALAALHRSNASTTARRTFYIVFVDGYFADGTGRRDTVLGVSIGASEVIGMFKPVIESTSFPKRVEQVTLVHELGHAVGLVNNGVPPVNAAHHDSAHGAHCARTDCVMYWTVSSGSIVDFILDNVVSNADVLFGIDCADDTDAASPQ